MILTGLILGLLAQVTPSITPNPATTPTLNVTTESVYGGTQLNWDADTSKWVGCLSHPFAYKTPGLICGTASGTAIVRIEMDTSAIVTLRWNAGYGGVCAVDATCSSTFANSYPRTYGVVPGPKWMASATYNKMSERVPPMFGFTMIVIAAP